MRLYLSFYRTVLLSMFSPIKFLPIDKKDKFEKEMHCHIFISL